MPQQRLLADEAAWESMLAYIKDDDVTERLRARWTREQGRPTAGDLSVERWADLESEIDKVWHLQNMRMHLLVLYGDLAVVLKFLNVYNHTICLAKQGSNVGFLS